MPAVAALATQATTDSVADPPLLTRLSSFPASVVLAAELPITGSSDQLPNHLHSNLKAFEEHIQRYVSGCFVTE